jgi:uncharacterized protein YaaW (UPF0174 family)
MAAATEQILKGISLPASADLSGNQFYFVYVNTSGQIAVQTTVHSDIDGVLQDKPNAAGRAGDVAVFGVTKVVTGAAVAVADYVTNDTAGKGVTATSGQKAHGRALSASTGAGQIITVLLGGPKGTV